MTDSEARAFHEIEAAHECWSTRELERQIAALHFERLARGRDRDHEHAHWQERDLEQAIIDRLESFLLELGKGFCFVARQRRLTLDGDHFYVDLVLYNRLLRCFVLVDLKLGLTDAPGPGADADAEVNYYDRYQLQAWEAPTVGIVLCSEKNEAMVRITLPDDAPVHASRYQLYLPSERELREEVVAQRERLELARRLQR